MAKKHSTTLAIIVIIILPLTYFAFDKFVLDPARNDAEIEIVAEEIVLTATAISDPLSDEEKLLASPSWKAKGTLAAWNDPDSEVFEASLRHASTAEAAASMREAAADYGSKLIGYLANRDEDIQFGSARVLGSIGEAARQSFPVLVNMMDHGDRQARQVAIIAVDYMGESGQELAPQVARLLTDPDLGDDAAWALAKVGPGAREQASLLVDALANLLAMSDDGLYDDISYLSFAQALKSMGEEALAMQAPELVKLLEEYDPFMLMGESIVPLFRYLGVAEPDVTHALVALLDSPQSSVRINGALALGFMGNTSQEVLFRLEALIIDSDREIANSAASALVMIRAPKWRTLISELALSGYIERSAAWTLLEKLAQSPEKVPDLAVLLRDTEEDVRMAAAQVAGFIGEAANGYSPQLWELLADQGEDPRVRFAAAEALGKFGPAARLQAPRLVGLLADLFASDLTELEAAVFHALEKLGTPAKQYAATQIAEGIWDSDPKVREKAVLQLLILGPAASQYASQVAELLNDSDINVRGFAAMALGAMGEAASPYQSLFEMWLNDANEDTRNVAQGALAVMGLPEIVPLLFNVEATETALFVLSVLVENVEKNGQQLLVSELLTSRYAEMRWIGALAMELRGQRARPYAGELAALVTDEDPEISEAATASLEATGPLDARGILAILNEVERDASATGQLRFLAHLLAGGERETETLVQWLGRPVERPFGGLTRENGVYTLDVFEKAWLLSESLPEVRKDLRAQIAEVIQAVNWDGDDLSRLTRHAENLAGTPEEVSVRNAIVQLEPTRWVVNIANVWLGHAVFWLALIFLYPRSPKIQALFFWNPWVRRFIGLGYIGFALTWVPYFRAKLFVPFQRPLLADAALEGFDKQAYFPDSEVTDSRGMTFPIREAIPEIKGQLMLEGDSGLGKTMFLRYLAQRARRMMVYLPAKKCAQGVMGAIQDKLQGPASDLDFLRTLIYIGALDICIDGLNEVDADTRAKISDFAERNFKGNAILATQPLGWNPPSTAIVYVMQPLSRGKIEQFLLTRTTALPEDASVTGEAYEVACQRYLDSTLDEQQPEEALSAVQRVLSNPMDLTIVAQMLAHGQQPDLFHLHKQQYSIMADEYHRLHLGQEFPLEAFSERVYEMRLDLQTALPVEFLKELQVMERYKLVLSRQYHDAHDKLVTEWYFRHDKIMDFFIVQTFLGSQNNRPQQHLGDPRFRGVYLMLAMLMPLPAATALREQLIHYAADTKDHTVSDTFINLVSSRRAAYKNDQAPIIH